MFLRARRPRRRIERGSRVRQGLVRTPSEGPFDADHRHAFERGDDCACRRGFASGLLVRMAHYPARGVGRRVEAGGRSRNDAEVPQALHRESWSSVRWRWWSRLLCFPPKPAIAIALPGSSRRSKRIPSTRSASSFWIVVDPDWVRLPVQLPRGTQQAVAIAPIMGSLIPRRTCRRRVGCRDRDNRDSRDSEARSLGTGRLPITRHWSSLRSSPELSA